MLNLYSSKWNWKNMWITVGKLDCQQWSKKYSWYLWPASNSPLKCRRACIFYRGNRLKRYCINRNFRASRMLAHLRNSQKLKCTDNHGHVSITEYIVTTSLVSCKSTQLKLCKIFCCIFGQLCWQHYKFAMVLGLLVTLSQFVRKFFQVLSNTTIELRFLK